MGGNAAGVRLPLLPPDFLALAQLEERRFTKPKAAGSTPAGEAKRQRVAQMAARKLGELEVASSILATLTTVQGGLAERLKVLPC